MKCEVQLNVRDLGETLHPFLSFSFTASLLCLWPLFNFNCKNELTSCGQTHYKAAVSNFFFFFKSYFGKIKRLLLVTCINIKTLEVKSTE